jgi:eukaryotic-like serine/threonine-protein kinase
MAHKGRVAQAWDEEATMEPRGEAIAVCEGEIVGGKYLVRRVLGRGGMGYVLEAEHIELGHRVALKFLASSLCANARAVERFQREGRSAVRIQSEHVARVVDVGRLESGVPFLAMEFLDGIDLGQLLATQGPLGVSEAVDYVLQACDAIGEAHSLGIVHRDIKPANLFLTRRRDGSSLVKVLDFGISKAMHAQHESLSMTATDAVLGSPVYMSPEHLRSSKNVDSRTDIWALGTVLYELLAGRPPFMAETLLAVYAAVEMRPVAPLETWRADVPAAVGAAVSCCLEKDPNRRYQTLAELGAALAPFGPAWAPILAERLHKLLGTGAVSVPAEPAQTQPSDPPPGNRRPEIGLAQTARLARGAAPAVVPGAPMVDSPTPKANQAATDGLDPRSAPAPTAEPDLPTLRAAQAGDALVPTAQTAASWGSTKGDGIGAQTSRGGLWLGRGAGVLALVLVIGAAAFLLRGSLAARSDSTSGSASAVRAPSEAANDSAAAPGGSAGPQPSGSREDAAAAAASGPVSARAQSSTAAPARADAPAPEHVERDAGSASVSPSTPNSAARAMDPTPGASADRPSFTDFGGRKF